MSTLELNGSEMGDGSPKPIGTSEETIGDVCSIKSENNTDFDGYEDILAAQGDDTSSGYINFLRDYVKRYGDFYTCEALVLGARERWADMSFRHRCDYCENPAELLKIKCDGDGNIYNFDSDESMEKQDVAPRDNFFGGRNVTGGSDNVCHKKRAPKCGKPKRSCAKPKRTKSCSKPKRMKSCAKPKAAKSCAKPKPKCKPACAKAKPRCPKPKPRCSKPKPSCPM
ncbi:histone-like protein 18C [Drosophila subpulchrella]|uniref:histone-like protein 18C n=1 Tax=Drosophila subpulchrella TaxID=1486046 RepID=UPI0018A15370|nr:histone-like protein 18C [Drosophila subpulchrella]